MLNVGLLGAGRIAGVHAKAISSHPGSRLAAVSDINREASSKLAAQYGAQDRSTRDVLDDDTINAVLIATSTDTHSDLIEQAVEAGKAVLCEKPVDLSLARARACSIRGDIGIAELLSITSFDPAPPPVSWSDKSVLIWPVYASNVRSALPSAANRNS
jgi:myo-inositol 2-dehydrogenase / D-chiro-inositol 1-dehydrogenase